MGKRFPMVFAESDADFDAETLQEYQDSLHRYYPPSSSNETEYHIFKFYNFNSNLVRNMLHNLEMNVGFPFRMTDIQNAIINLKPKGAILVLGHSGTGKTICCLHRLFSQYTLSLIHI